MNLDKSQKRLNKLHKRGFHGYPLVTIRYYGANPHVATKVVVGFIEDEASATFTESFTTQTDIRVDEIVQTTLLKIIDRAQAKSVTIYADVTIENELA